MIDELAPAPSDTDAPRPALHVPTLRWVLALRALVALGQLGVCAVAPIAPSVPLTSLALAVLTALASTVLLARWSARMPVPPHALGLALGLDCVVLTALLFATGGSSNAFSALYLVYVTLAAVTLHGAWRWGLVAFSIGAYASLFLARPSAHEHAPSFSGHVEAMFVAFALSAVLIAFFVGRVAEALAERERELAAAQRRADRAGRQAALTTLAAGAAHELATPLGTIAVVAGELARAEGLPDDVVADAQLVAREVARCRAILDRLATDAGAPTGEALAPCAAHAVIDDALAGLEDASRVTVECPAELRVTVPRAALAQALRSLVKNALEASAQPVRVEVRAAPDAVRFVIVDRGPGMPPEVLGRAGEPFFTTKDTGRGMGLGLFLVRTLAERLGGALSLESSDAGTRATLRLPAQVLPPPP